jgi:hypothetical protein
MSALALAVRLFSLGGCHRGVDDLVEMSQRRFVFAGPTGSLRLVRRHFLGVLDAFEVLGDLDNLLTGEISVGETRVHSELIQQEQADVIVVALTT